STYNDAICSYGTYFQDRKQEDILNNEEDVVRRKKNVQTLTNHFYDLVTDFYEYGWGASFHFARCFKGEPFPVNIARHEDFLALKLGLKPGMECLDVGCGVGGPMREIAKFSGAFITGINNNAYQVNRNRLLSSRIDLSSLCKVIQGDFHGMPFPSNSFDATYAIEATCHSQNLELVYAEIFRVLKPGARFACYEWLTTEKYDESNVEHKRIMLGLEEGNSCPKLASIPDCLAALRKVGFEIIEHEDLADSLHPQYAQQDPWYSTLDGRCGLSVLAWYYQWAMKPGGRRFTSGLVSFLETIRLAPRGSTGVARLLNLGADMLVEAGKLEIFTPMFFFVVQKPVDAVAPSV
ncbi:Delta(24)-sterol C-methyltransferase, partial [Quaeritorhiza haematococci]